jgi:hypothetical protein
VENVHFTVVEQLLTPVSFKKSNSGAACTCVATEYHYHEHNDHALEIEYFTVEDLRGQFTELLQSYRHYHLHVLRDDQVQGDERTDIEEKAKVAQDTFHAAFRQRLAQNEQFLLDRSEGAVLETLLNWARESGLPLMETSGTDLKEEIFDNASDCSDRLAELTSEPNSPYEISAWPFIRKIKFVIAVTRPCLSTVSG